MFRELVEKRKKQTIVELESAGAKSLTRYIVGKAFDELYKEVDALEPKEGRSEQEEAAAAPCVEPTDNAEHPQAPAG